MPEINRERGQEVERIEGEGATVAFAFHALSRAHGLDQLERMMLAYVAHPQGAGFERAHLLTWDPATAGLICRSSHVALRPEIPLAATLEQTQRSIRSSAPAESLPAWHGMRLDPARLEGAPAAAWQRLACATEAGRGEPSPWREGAMIGAIALRRRGLPWALVVGEWADSAAGAAHQGTLDLVRFALEAALETVDRAGETARRARHAAAVAEMARGCVAPANLAEVLHLAVRLVSSGTGAAGGALWLAPERAGSADGHSASRRAPRLEVTFGAARDRERLGRALQPVAASAIKASRPRISDAPTRQLDLSPESAAALNAFAVVPLAAYDRVLGAIAVYDPSRAHPSEPRGFDAEEIEFVHTIAHLAALALVEAGHIRALERAELRNRELAGWVARQERLCALGEKAALMAREARHPIASIRAFARRLERAMAEADPNREYVEVILAESDRLDGVLTEPLEEAVVDPSAMRIESMNAIIQEALEHAGTKLVRRRIRLMKKLSPEIPSLLLDGVRVRRALANVLENALESVSIGGRIRIETRAVAQHLVVEMAHDAPHAPGEALEQMFVPFASGRGGSAGIGLGVALQIVRDHGGEVRVKSEGEWGTVVAFTFPVTGNQDRRHTPHDRRRVRGDRRARLPRS